jgi:hypothetical protein
MQIRLGLVVKTLTGRGQTRAVRGAARLGGGGEAEDPRPGRPCGPAAPGCSLARSYKLQDACSHKSSLADYSESQASAAAQVSKLKLNSN